MPSSTVVADRPGAKQNSKSPSRKVPTPGANPILIGIILFYIAVLAGMVAFNRYLFLLKSLVVPALLLGALLSGRLKSFVNDWALFLGAVVFFDFCRGLAFALTTHFELPMYLGYVIAWERWLCGGAIAPIALQQWRSTLSDPTWLDRLFVLVYSTHFVFFFVFGFAVWYRRPASFRTYAIAIAAVMYVGLVFYALVPTVPPWAASSEFFVLPPIEQIVRAFYNVHLPEALTIFDTNPIAAMPSLHAALPAICALLAIHYWGWRAGPMVVYTCAVWLAVLYLGEHYLVDVIAGALLAVAVYAATTRWVGETEGQVANAGAHRSNAPRTSRGSAHGDERWATTPIAISIVLAVGAVGLGQLSAKWMGALPLTRAFIEAELVGRSRLANYYLGRRAFAEGDYATAEINLGRALDEIEGAEDRRVVRTLLGISGTRTHNYSGVIDALEPLHPEPHDVSNLALLGNAYIERDQYARGLATLREARDRYPSEPDPIYWLTRHQYLRGDIDRGQVERILVELESYPPETAGPFRRSLADILKRRHAEKKSEPQRNADERR